MVFAQNKKKNYFLLNFFIFLAIVGGLFFLSSPEVFASPASDAKEVTAITASSSNSGMIGTAFSNAFKWILYGIFVAIGWLVSAALTLFEWSIDPSYISGSKSFFNAASTYEMWKFVRDFFNLFFILALLYLAFTTIFQVAKDYKKSLLSLVIMALLVNFSFPISRFLIDVANVPMYFFANQIFSGTTKPGQDALSSVLSASKLENILIQKQGSGDSATFDPSHNDFSRLIMAIVFMFIFAITLLVLAIMFVIRLIALVILVIFSSVGFVGGLFPMTAKLSSQWWDKFLNYAFYGPAAMLMLLIATRFFVEVGKDSTFNSMKAVSSGITQNSSMSSFIGSMAMFSIPIVMLWFAIGLAGSFSVAGAGAVTGWGQGFIKSTGKKFGNGAKWVGVHNPVSNYAKGVGQGAASRLADSKLGKLWSSPSKFEARGKGLAKGVGTGKGVSGAVQSEFAKLHQKEVNERVKKDKENQVNRSTHVNNLKNSKDPVEQQAAALALAESKEIRTAGEFSLAMASLKDNADGLLKVVDNAKPEAIGGIDSVTHTAIQDSFYEKEADGKTIKVGADGKPVIREGMQNTHDAYNSKLRKEGNIKVKVDYEIAQKGVKADDMSDDANAQRSQVYKDNFDKMAAEAFTNQKDIYKDPAFKKYAESMAPKRMQTIMEKVMEKSGSEAQEAWAAMADNMKKDTTGPKIAVVEERAPRSKTVFPS